MRVLLIDNYDSFTYNLANLIFLTTGEWPVVLRNDAVDLQAVRAFKPDAIVLSPGPGHPGRGRDFGVCEQIVRELTVPTLGVCLGHQGIAHCFGASVSIAAEPVHGQTSAVYHSCSELFDRVPQGFTAVRYHSLIVEEPLPPELTKLAWTEDGTVMALRHKEKPFWGVQFHPESISSEHCDTLIANFFRLADLAQPLTIEVPFWREPEAVYAALFAKDVQSFWLDSSMLQDGEEQHSYLGGSSVPGSYLWSHSVNDGTLLDKLSVRLRDAKMRPPSRFGFHGGFVGYFGYELKGECGYSNGHRSSLPDAHLLYAPAVVDFDHHRSVIRLHLTNRNDPALQEWAKHVIEALSDVVPLEVAEHCVLQLKSADTREEYLWKIQRAQESIRAGETYEACLTTAFVGPPIEDSFAFYRHLRSRNPAPYSAFLRFGATAICCTSPEQFLRIDHRRVITSKPVKGTAPRSADPASLASDVKTKSEHLMIVDLVRNDLSRVCEPGSVHVPRFMSVESYATVHQMVSTIAGKLRTDVDAVDCIRAAFPGGSMTGAPKHRTLEILDELEGRARGPYSGALGFIGLDGCMDLNIVIRTAVCTESETRVGAGGAIVALSRSADEWDEVQLKAAAVSGQSSLF